MSKQLIIHALNSMVVLLITVSQRSPGRAGGIALLKYME